MRSLRKLRHSWRRHSGSRFLRNFQVQPAQQQLEPQSKPASVVSWRYVLALNTDEFCRNTSIHGLKYINSRKLHNADRLFFAAALLAVLGFAGFLMQDAFDKWNTTPVIVGINPEPTYITNEPFPAVTICNLNQALACRAAQFAKDMPQYAMLQVLCRRKLNSQLSRGNNNWEQLISNISQPCSALVIGCRFGALDNQCERMFYPIITDEGLCCVFNMLHPRFMYKHNVPLTLRNISTPKGYQAVNWHAELGYNRPLGKPHHQYYPQAALGIGESLGLSLTLDVGADDYYCSSASSIGFKVALHSPNESPNVRETGFLLSPGLETKLRIEPAKMITELQLRQVQRRYRHCLFHDEGKLRYFVHYTQRNCEMECMSRLLLQHCGCVVFYMPRINGNDTICSIRETQCVERVRLHTVGSTGVASYLDSCLPSCFDLTFNSFTYSTRISAEGFKFANPQLKNFSLEHLERSIAVVHMYFKEQTFRASKQTEFIGFSDFLSNVGGLMGLFLGFSFLSIVECIYFALIRPCRTYAEHKNQRFAQRLELTAATPQKFAQQAARKWFETELGQLRQQRQRYAAYKRHLVVQNT
ncbi:pickpocket protein 28 [Drosophila busckii]|uniref:pickpocket protein 28 n=1 Tax=Drosophila busckii TaxID=30019 RepID=UPI00083EB46E|nr:pickpocket protein 28 [Drosophila busckii]